MKFQRNPDLEQYIKIEDYKVYVIFRSFLRDYTVPFEDIKTWMLTPLDGGPEWAMGVVVYLHSLPSYPVYSSLSRKDMEELWCMARQTSYQQDILYTESRKIHSRSQLLILD
jgi:hypothetical protein